MTTNLEQYNFLAPPTICFGSGRRRELGSLVKTLGHRALVVWGSRTLKSSQLGNEIYLSLSQSGIEAIDVTTISHEPLVSDVDQTTNAVRKLRVDEGTFMLAIGGGSAIDLAKAVAAMATNLESETVKDYLEGVGKGLQLTQRPLSIVAVPTTAGTGSEATKNAVISSLAPPFKKSLRSDLLMPRIVLIDPELTVSCLSTVTAHSGMDAIAQCIESYVSRKAKPIASALALQGFLLATEAIVAAMEQGTNIKAREAMAHAALLSGMALANSGLGMAHGVAAALGIHCGVPHGLACATMLPISLRVNRLASKTRYAELERAAQSCSSKRTLDESNAERDTDAFIARVDKLLTRLGIPRSLSALGVSRDQLPQIVASSYGNSMDGNPVQLSPNELTAVLEDAF